MAHITNQNIPKITYIDYNHNHNNGYNHNHHNGYIAITITNHSGSKIMVIFNPAYKEDHNILLGRPLTQTQMNVNWVVRRRAVFVNDFRNFLGLFASFFFELLFGIRSLYCEKKCRLTTFPDTEIWLFQFHYRRETCRPSH